MLSQMTADPSRNTAKTFRYYPSDIGLAASHAAIELERCLDGEPKGFESAFQFGPLLTKSRPRNFRVESAFRRSLNGSPPNSSPVNRDQAASDRLLKQLENLESIGYEEKQEVLSFLLNFLTALDSPGDASLRVEVGLQS